MGSGMGREGEGKGICKKCSITSLSAIVVMMSNTSLAK